MTEVEIATGAAVAVNETVALAVFVESAALAAVMVTGVLLLIEAGAVYKPLLEILPTAGLRDHVTEVFVVPVTEAVNCWVCEAATLALVGVIEMATPGARTTLELALLLLSAMLVATTATVCCEVIELGAVYSPLLEIEPLEGLMDQLIPVLLVPDTLAANC